MRASMLVALVALSGTAFFVFEHEALQYAAWDVLILACTTAAYLGMRSHGALGQGHWKAFLSGLIAFLFGSLIATVIAIQGGSPTVDTEISDAITLGGYGFMFTALILLARARTPHGDFSDLIDALIIVGGIGLALWIAWIGPHALGPEMSITEQVSAAAFPAFNLVLLTLLIRLTFSPGPRIASYWLLVGAVICSLVASQWNLFAFEDGSYRPGHPLEIPRMGAYLLAALAALHPSMAELGRTLPDAHRVLTEPRLLIFGIASLATPLALLWYDGNWSSDDIAVLIAGASVIFFLMVVRMRTLLNN
ncbi:MAG: hypothetical protein ACLGHL_09615, partial [Actinomycetota bacterium]